MPRVVNDRRIVERFHDMIPDVIAPERAAEWQDIREFLSITMTQLAWGGNLESSPPRGLAGAQQFEGMPSLWLATAWDLVNEQIDYFLRDYVESTFWTFSMSVRDRRAFEAARFPAARAFRRMLPMESIYRSLEREMPSWRVRFPDMIDPIYYTIQSVLQPAVVRIRVQDPAPGSRVIQPSRGGS